MTSEQRNTTTDPAFDWYQFSAQAGINYLREVFEPIEAIEPFHDEKAKLAGYGWALKMGGPGGSLLIHYGGRNGDEFGPNVAATGPLAPQVADLVRATGMPHGVGRADVKLDFLGDFDACRLRFIKRCDQAGMAAADAGSCPESLKQLGRTVYGGARSSFYRPTLYQKGLQLGEGFPENLIRLEHRFTPTKSGEKRQLSHLSPAQMIGIRPVARDLTEHIAALAVEPYKLDRYPKQKGPYFWLLNQYGALLREMQQDHGSWAAVGQQIGLDLEKK